jgi:uncharacterized protein (DUF342 family)
MPSEIGESSVRIKSSLVDISSGPEIERGGQMFSLSFEKLEKKIKELNAVKGEYRSDLEEAEKKLKRHEIDNSQFERVKIRNEEHIERLNEKIREIRNQMASMKK